MNKKGQMNLSDAPSVVLIVALAFLILATLAFIGLKFGDSIAPETSGSSLSTANILSANLPGDYYNSASTIRNVACVLGTARVTTGTNNNTVIGTGNYSAVTTRGGCGIRVTSAADDDLENRTWNYTYTYVGDLETDAVNVTNAMNTEINNNTGIVGIVLTISLIGIVLAVLLSVFVASRFGSKL